MINILRNGNDLGSYSIKTLKRLKTMLKSEAGYECAVLLDGFEILKR